MPDINSRAISQSPELGATAAGDGSAKPGAGVDETGGKRRGSSPRRRPARAGDAEVTENAGAAARPNPLSELEADGTSSKPADLVKVVELLFFAYRDFTGDADELLEDLGYGRAHHRVIHFVGRHPGLRVADLLDILRITKQSLARVLKQLIDEGFVVQKAGETDRRERHLLLTQKGRNFADKLTRLQCARVGKALETVGPAGRELVEAFLVAMISDHDQAAVAALFEKANQNEHEKQHTGRHKQHDADKRK